MSNQEETEFYKEVYKILFEEQHICKEPEKIKNTINKRKFNQHDFIIKVKADLLDDTKNIIKLYNFWKKPKTNVYEAFIKNIPDAIELLSIIEKET
jgi:hypothetical protein